MEAASRGHLEIVNTLILHGADIEAKSNVRIMLQDIFFII